MPGDLLAIIDETLNEGQVQPAQEAPQADPQQSLADGLRELNPPQGPKPEVELDEAPQYQPQFKWVHRRDGKLEAVPVRSSHTGYMDPVRTGTAVVEGFANVGLSALEGAQNFFAGDGALEATITDADGSTQKVTGARLELNKKLTGHATDGPEAVVAGVAQFMTGFAGWTKVLGSVGFAESSFYGAATVRAMTAGALTDATMFDPTGGRLSDLIEEYPALQNPITEYLKSDIDDDQAAARFKNALEGIVMGGAFDGLVQSLRGVKRIVRAGKAGGDKAALEMARKVSEELNPTAHGAPIEGKAPEVAVPEATLPKPEVTLEAPIKDYITSVLKDGWLGGEPKPNPAFNLDTILTGNEPKNILNLMTDAIAPELQKASGGVRSLARTEDMARILGTDQSSLAISLREAAGTAQRMDALLVAGKRLMNDISVDISKEASKVASGASPDRLNKLLDYLADTQASLKGLQTGAARTTSAGRIRTDATGKALVSILEAAEGDLGVVAQLARADGGLFKKGTNAVMEYWINALLSSPKTHAVNTTSAALNTFIRPLERLTGSAISLNVPAMKQAAGELVRLHTFVWDSLKAAKLAFTAEHGVLEAASKVDARVPAISGQAFGLDPEGWMGSTVDWLGKAVRVPSRVMMTTDEFFKQLNYRSNVSARAYSEGSKMGLSGDQLAKYVDDRLINSFDETGRAVDAEALMEAREVTFTTPAAPGSITAGLSKAANRWPVIRAVVPFINTPVNILKTSGRHIPLIANFMPSLRADLKGANGVQRQMLARGQLAFGGAMLAGGTSLVMSGAITGGGPRDPKSLKRLRESGWQPYSVKVGDQYYSISRMDPYALPITVMADLAELSGQVDPKDYEETAFALMAAISKNLSDRTYLKGLSLFFDAVGSGEPNKMERWISNYAGSAVPSGVADIRRSQDPMMREVRSIVDALRNRTPGFSESLDPKRNVLGEPVAYKPGWGPDFAPMGTWNEENDKVLSEIANLAKPVHDASPMLGDVDLRDFKAKNGKSAFDRYQELVAEEIDDNGTKRTLREDLVDLFKSSEWAEWKQVEGAQAATGDEPTTTQQVSLRIARYREFARNELAQEIPELREALLLDTMNRQKARAGVATEAQIPEALRSLLQQVNP